MNKIANPRSLSPNDIVQNYHRGIIKVKHAELKRVSSESDFKSVCPVCDEGMLLMRRDPSSLHLCKDDNCVLCGTRFEYTDLEDSVVLSYRKTKILKEFIPRFKYFWKEQITLSKLSIQGDYFSTTGKILIVISTTLFIIPWVLMDVFDKKLSIK